MKTTTVRISTDLHSELKNKSDELNQKFGRMIERILRAWLFSHATKAKSKTKTGGKHHGRINSTSK